MDRPSAPNTTGLTFVFDTREFQGRVVGSLEEVTKIICAGGLPEIDGAGSGECTGEMPLILDLMGFK
jgi:hypothetical protein